MVAVKQNLILEAFSYQKILKNLFLSARVWAPILVSKSPWICPCNRHLFVPPVSAINCRPDSLRVFSAYTSVLVYYCMGSSLSVRPVDQQRRQLAVTFYSTWYYTRGQEMLSFQQSFHSFIQHTSFLEYIFSLWLLLFSQVSTVKGSISRLPVL